LSARDEGLLTLCSELANARDQLRSLSQQVAFHRSIAEEMEARAIESESKLRSQGFTATEHARSLKQLPSVGTNGSPSRPLEITDLSSPAERDSGTESLREQLSRSGCVLSALSKERDMLLEEIRKLTKQQERNSIVQPAARNMSVNIATSPSNGRKVIPPQTPSPGHELVGHSQSMEKIVPASDASPTRRTTGAPASNDMSLPHQPGSPNQPQPSPAESPRAEGALASSTPTSSPSPRESELQRLYTETSAMLQRAQNDLAASTQARAALQETMCEMAQRHEDEVRKIQDQLHTASDSRDNQAADAMHWHMRYDKLSVEFESLRGDYSALESQTCSVNGCESQIRKLEQSLTEARTRFDSAQRDVAEAHTRAIDAQRQLHEMQQRYQQLEIQMDQERKQKQSAEQIAALHASNVELQTALRSQCDALQRANTELKEQLSVSRQECEELSLTLEEERQNAITTHGNINKLMQDAREGLIKQMQQMERDHASALCAAAARENELKSSLEAEKTRCRAAHESLDALNADRDRLRSLEKKYTSLQSEHASVQAMHQQTTTSLNEALDTLRMERDRLAQTESRMKMLAKSEEELRCEKDESMSALQPNDQYGSTALKEARVTIDTLRLRIMDLENEIAKSPATSFSTPVKSERDGTARHQPMTDVSKSRRQLQQPFFLDRSHSASKAMHMHHFDHHDSSALLDPRQLQSHVDALRSLLEVERQSVADLRKELEMAKQNLQHSSHERQGIGWKAETLTTPHSKTFPSMRSPPVSTMRQPLLSSPSTHHPIDGGDIDVAQAQLLATRMAVSEARVARIEQQLMNVSDTPSSLRHSPSEQQEPIHTPQTSHRTSDYPPQLRGPLASAYLLTPGSSPLSPSTSSPPSRALLGTTPR